MDDVREGRGAEGSWEQVATGFAELGGLLGSGLTDDKNKEGPSWEELRQAWGDFVFAAQGLGQALSTTVRDPEVRKGAKDAFGSLVDAVGATVRSAAARARPDQTAGDEAADILADDEGGADDKAAGDQDDKEEAGGGPPAAGSA